MTSAVLQLVLDSIKNLPHKEQIKLFNILSDRFTPSNLKTLGEITIEEILAE